MKRIASVAVATALLLGTLGVAQSSASASVSAGQPSAGVPMAKKKAKPWVEFSSKKRLVVDVNPDLRRSKNWKIKLQRKSKGKWRKVGIYRTKGKSEIRKFKVKEGKYRVKVYARPGYRSVTTKAYRFTRTTPTPPPDITRVMGHSEGSTPEGSAISGDGRWIVYNAIETDLGDNDTNGVSGLFLFDRDTGLTQRVADHRGRHPALSADGRWITYSRSTFNVDTLITRWDVFLFDRDTETTRRVSVNSNGDQATGFGSSMEPAISADGRWITYHSSATDLVENDTNSANDVFLFDRDTGTTRRVSVNSNGDQANGRFGSVGPAISAGGRWITYTSDATNLVDNDTNSAEYDVFLFDRDTGLTQRVATAGISPSISADGRWIAYHTTDTAGVFLFDRDTGVAQRVATAAGGPSISADGRWITYNGQGVFLFDRDTGLTRRVSVNSNGVRSPAISGDGRWITYESGTSPLIGDERQDLFDLFLARMW